MGTWYTRAVLFVADIERSVRFYTEMLGFEKSWQHEHDGKPIVVQVNHQECEIILSLDSERAGWSRLFISLGSEDMQELKAQVEVRSVVAKETWWGYPSLEIRDPDGNELLFPLDESDDHE
ncbi:MAG TPA: VOC family protein [Dehalococcoidia bacterium]|nr:VOC family protein [Dehalococcoidia bacterium]